MQIARVLSGFFLVLQIIVLLEFTYVANEWLLERAEHWATKTALVVGESAAAVCQRSVCLDTVLSPDGRRVGCNGPSAWCVLEPCGERWCLVRRLQWPLCAACA